MEKPKQNTTDLIFRIFDRFEQFISLCLAAIVALIIAIALVRIVQNFNDLFIRDFFRPENISFKDYQEIFGKIMTLLISIEFMTSILKVFKTHDIRVLVKDVVLITALAIARKMIVYDYEHHDPMSTIVLGGLLVSIGVFYFLISREQDTNISQHKRHRGSHEIS